MIETAVVGEYNSVSRKLDVKQLALLRGLGRKIGLTYEEAGTWRITANSWVGTIAVGDLRLLIRPKVSTANLFHLLEGGGSSLIVGTDLFGYDQSPDLLAAFATFYARQLEHTVAQGLHRSYRMDEDRLNTIRGRVDLREQQRLAGLALPVACRFDEYTADVALNRIVKAGAQRLLRVPGVTVATRRLLTGLLVRFEEVSALAPGDLASPMVFDRLTRHYEPIDRLARLALENTSIVNLTGEADAAVFLVDMIKLFEEFVHDRLTRYLRGRLDVRGQHAGHLDVHGKVRIVPDLVFSRGQRVVYVADTKYKLLTDGFAREADYYQLLAYATTLELPEGLLIYCQNDGDVPPECIAVHPTKMRLKTLALHLGVTPADVERQLRSLADELVTVTWPRLVAVPA